MELIQYAPMIEFIQTVLALIVTISILVTIHEFGHYWVARLFNVHVIRFSVGFGKIIFSRRGPSPNISDHSREGVAVSRQPSTRANEKLEGTEFAVAAIPLGGYVKFLDERETYVPDDQLHMAFNRKPVWQRIAIVAAGPIANFLLAIAAYWMLFVTGVSGVVPMLGDIDENSPAGQAGLRGGEEIVAIDGAVTPTWSQVNMRLFERLGDTGEIVIRAKVRDSFDAEMEYVIGISGWLSDADEPSPTRDLGLSLKVPEMPAVIGGVTEDGRAKLAGLLGGDRVLYADALKIRDWAHLVEIIREHPERSLDLVVERQGATVDLIVTPAAILRGNDRIGFIGASVQGVDFPPEMRTEVNYPVYAAWIPAVEKTWEVTLFTLSSIKKMIVGAISTKNLSGPITIAKVANATAESGLESFIGFIALLSISLGVINLLPIPVLDGGHLLYYFVELLVGRPVPERIQVWGLQIGVFFIVSIMFLAIYNDLTRL